LLQDPPSPLPSTSLALDSTLTWTGDCAVWPFERLASSINIVAGEVLRFCALYTWARPTLSLGFHQRRWKPSGRLLQEQGGSPFVRRPWNGRQCCMGLSHLCPALAHAPRPPALAYASLTDSACDRHEELGQAPALRGSGRQPAASMFCQAALRADLVIRPGVKNGVAVPSLWRQAVCCSNGSVQLDHCRQLSGRKVFAADPPQLIPCRLSRIGTGQKPLAPLR